MRLSGLYHRLCRGRLRHGPFRGMRYVSASIGSSYGAKLLGTYECELRGLLDALSAREFRTIVNVGAAPVRTETRNVNGRRQIHQYFADTAAGATAAGLLAPLGVSPPMATR